MKFLSSNKLLKSTLIYTVCSGVNKAVPFLILPILSYYLLPQDFGIVANYNVLFVVVTLLVNIGLDGAISARYYTLSKSEIKIFVFNGLLIVVGATVIVGLVVILFSSVIYNWFKVSIEYQLWSVISSLFAVITTLNLALWRLEEKPIQYGTYEISQTLINVMISLVLVISFNKGWAGRLDGIIISTILYGIFSLWFLFRRSYVQIQLDKSVVKAILSFGIPLIPHALSIWLRSGADRVIITKFFGEYHTGLYATGFQFGVFIAFVTMAFNNAFVPYLYKNLSEQNQDVLLKNKIKLVKLTYLCIIGYVLMGVLFTFASDFLIKNFFSDKYIEAKDFIVWAIISQVFQGFYLLFVNYLFFAQRTKLLASITISCSLLQVIVSYILVQSMGPLGAAYSSVIVSVLNFFLVMLAATRVLRMPWLNMLRKRF
ncbi:lipopolysaccharide biosynthesis protein [Sphingobacterium puteale]|uniref:lipopolysaccharide biosynthesis protein n=1 Tax=Sphingobacterium puteale TaxID=2420510 RepID=UPI003D959D87